MDGVKTVKLYTYKHNGVSSYVVVARNLDWPQMNIQALAPSLGHYRDYPTAQKLYFFLAGDFLSN